MKANSLPTNQEGVEKLCAALTKHQSSFYPLLGNHEYVQSLCTLDFSALNIDLQQINLQDTRLFNDYVFGTMDGKKALIGVGGYLENRVIYQSNIAFQGPEPRSIHLGIDLWAKEFTPLYAPLDGVVHSFKDNNASGDYGPTIILEHELEGLKFFTLYGHLSRRSLNGIQENQLIKKGTAFTELGPYPENGNWPPHLHFQIITDMQGKSGDFPGVAAPSEIEKYKAICPDPNLILNLDILK